MTLTLLKSKIHKARVTMADLHYEGSLGIDQDLMDIVGIRPWEKILVVNINNGERLETYAIPSPRGSKEFLLNGAAARKGSVGDQIIIMSFGEVFEGEADSFLPNIIVLDQENNIEVRKGALS
ncbi:MAG: aspartate 1-decarboxylase [Lentisphaeraceae bacterium]|nr:aspartate 1-decarboxylase [Lentisphaeraceae bacterium]